MVYLAPIIIEKAKEYVIETKARKCEKITIEERLLKLESAAIEQSQLFEEVAKINAAYVQVICGISNKIKWLIISNVVQFGIIIVLFAMVLKFNK